MNREVKEERERIKRVVIEEIDGMIAYREKIIKKRHRRNYAVLKNIRHRILYFIDNPRPYIKKKEGFWGILGVKLRELRGFNTKGRF